MKKTYLVIVLIAFILQIVCGCQKNDTPNSSYLQSNLNAKKMTIEILPSPPTSKSTSDEKVIEKFIETINECEKKEITSDGNNGWQILVSVQSGDNLTQYSVTSNILRIDNKVYEVNGHSLSNEITDIYNNIQEWGLWKLKIQFFQYYYQFLYY